MNLSETQVATKRFLVGVALLTTLYYTGRFTVAQGKSLARKVFPQKPPPVEAKFGKLPQLTLANTQIQGDPEYVLDTETGKFPKFPDRAKVYTIKEPQPNLLSEQRMKKLALDLDFKGEFVKLSASEFRWVDGKNNRTLEANAVTRHFTLNTHVNKLGAVVSSAPTITESDAKKTTENFLKSKALMASNDLENLTFSTVPSLITLSKFKDTKLIPSQAKIVKVDVHRSIPIKKLDQKGKPVIIGSYKILGPNPKDSLINFYVTNEGKVFELPIINFTYWEVDYNDGSDYFLSPIKEVWKTIRSGNGIIAYVKARSEDYYETSPAYTIDKIEIRDIYIAYYEPQTLSPYLQPIYVFEGQFTTKPQKGKLPEEGEIIIYYPAVRGDFVK